MTLPTGINRAIATTFGAFLLWMYSGHTQALKPGTPDPSFGESGNGLSVISAPGALTAYSAALDKNGCIIFSGAVNEPVLGRLNANGTLDPTFGIVEHDELIPHNVSLDRITVLKNEKILIASTWEGDFGNQWALCRFSPNGKLDSTFDANGSAPGCKLMPFGGTVSTAEEDGNGAVLAAGPRWNGTDYEQAVIRIEADGEIDSDFGTDGFASLPDLFHGPSFPEEISVSADGSFTLMGYYGSLSGGTIIVSRYTRDGVLDADFSEDGVAIAVESGFAAGFATALDGSVFVAAVRDSAQGGTLILSKLTADGATSPDFTAPTTPLGQVHVAPCTNAGCEIQIPSGNALSLLTNGKLMAGLAAYFDDVDATRLITLRFSSTGALDPDYGDATDMAFPPGIGASIALPEDPFLASAFEKNGTATLIASRFGLAGKLFATRFVGDLLFADGLEQSD